MCHCIRTVMLLMLAAWGASLPAQSPAPGVDPYTVAFWPFDDPQYLNSTLTDAGPHHYDLRLAPNGQLRVGRHGTSLAAIGSTGPAAMFAERAGMQSVAELHSREVALPTAIVGALQGPDWTWESWVKLEQSVPGDATLLHLTRDGGNTFYCAVVENGTRLHLRDYAAGNQLGFVIDPPLTPAADWTHVAITKTTIRNNVPAFDLYSDAGDARLVSNTRVVPGDREIYRLYVNGVQQAPPQAIGPGGPDGGGTLRHPGLIGVIYGDPDFVRPSSIEVIPDVNLYWGTSRGTGWSARWQGALRGPRTGNVTIRAEAQWGLRLYLNNALIISGWGPSAARSGVVTMAADTLTSMTLEFNQLNTDAQLRLYWSWPGQAETLIPASALSYSVQDEALAAAQLGGATGSARVFEMRVGTNQWGLDPLQGYVDELRLSRTCRYTTDFTPPASMTHGYGPDHPQPAWPSGPPLLFAGSTPEPLALGGRKHVFIDRALVSESSNLTLTPNSWLRRERLNMHLNGDVTVYDHAGQIRMFSGSGDMWAGGPDQADKTIVQVLYSNDGLNFTAPQLGLIEVNGSKQNNAVLRAPVQGQIFEDGNPAASPLTRYKFTAYYMTRGVYLFTSPDGLNWSRNEASLVPFDVGGGAESFWDDQRGEYFIHLRHEGFVAGRGSTGRAAGRSRTDDPFKPWPFTKVANPFVRLPLLTLPTLTEEFPIPFHPDANGQIYRTRAIKYPFAPDVYLAFIWRYQGTPPNDFRETELAVSRDGLTWTFLGQPFYMQAGGDLDGEIIKEALSTMGLVRCGYEIYNYCLVSTATHSGTGGSKGGMFRMAQRLDGFVSLDAGATTGTLTTRPFTFSGHRLQLNVNAMGSLRAALVNADGTAIEGYDFANCAPITGDFATTNVRWNGSEDLTALEGQPVRLKLRYHNTKLYALQFIP